MNPLQQLRSETAAWVLGMVVVGVLALVAFSQVGWLGIGLVGLVGLLISVRLDLHGGRAVADISHGSSGVRMYARQLAEEESRSSPEQKMAAAEERAKRSRVLYLINTVWIAMIAFGFGLFFLHQL
ncbi:MAG: hypothetical protein ACE5GS_12750 [Kiloniellaceae bacterium]